MFSCEKKGKERKGKERKGWIIFFKTSYIFITKIILPHVFIFKYGRLLSPIFCEAVTSFAHWPAYLKHRWRCNRHTPSGRVHWCKVELERHLKAFANNNSQLLVFFAWTAELFQLGQLWSILPNSVILIFIKQPPL